MARTIKSVNGKAAYLPDGFHLSDVLSVPKLKVVLAAIAPSSYQTDLSPVSFAYDYLKGLSINAPPPKVYKVTKCDLSCCDGEHTSTTGLELPNSLPIFPARAGLPWHTGLQCARQSKHWRTGLQISSELLELFAGDVAAKKVKKSNGASLASIAAKELQTIEEDRYTKFAAYLFPEANKGRMRLLAATILLILIFDDSWEEANPESLRFVQEDFVARLQGDEVEDPSQMTDLQSLITSVADGLRHEDNIAGNGGQEVIDNLVNFCRHGPPPQEFHTVGQYLDYRRIDVALAYILACVKFSIYSNVTIEDPVLKVFLSLISDHVSIVNDLASFDKEKQAYDAGKSAYLINVVAVVQKLCLLPNESSAKAISYAMQLDVERKISDEIRTLETQHTLSQDQWNFVEAVLEMAAGNVFYSVVALRYGGEKARIRT